MIARVSRSRLECGQAGPRFLSLQGRLPCGELGSLAALAAVLLAVAASQQSSIASQSAPAPPAQGQGKLIVYGDMALFQPPGHPENCILRNRFKRGEPVGWRMFVADPSTGKREESAQLVVHLNVSGKTVDVPMRYRATAAQPEREFWVAKWIVPQDAPVGIIRLHPVTATDSCGRSGEFRPFEVQASQLTIGVSILVPQRFMSRRRHSRSAHGLRRRAVVAAPQVRRSPTICKRRGAEDT